MTGYESIISTHLRFKAVIGLSVEDFTKLYLAGIIEVPNMEKFHRVGDVDLFIKMFNAGRSLK
jgi:hypothetical protein